MNNISPFKFLDAYTLKDSDYFFGRTKEIAQLYKMVFETPLILIYGLSGTGKTSLVQCGLASKFDGPDWFPFFIRNNQDINQSLHSALDECIEDTKERSLVEKVRYINRSYFRPVYLIFDQLEELFILGNKEQQALFVENIKTLIDAKLLCKIILIIREEYIGQLYEFESQIPYIFDFRLRVEPLNKVMAKQVVKSSFNKFNIQLEAPAEERLDEIVQNVSKKKSGIELPYLQVYLDKLYRDDYKRTYPKGTNETFPALEFTKEEIAELGNIDNVLESFLDNQQEAIQLNLNQKYGTLIPKDAVQEILNALVIDNTKRPIYFSRIQENNENEEGIMQINSTQKVLFPNLSDEIMTYAIQALDKSRLITFTNNDSSFELAHDSLAFLIDQKRTDQQRNQAEVLRSLLSNFKDYQNDKVKEQLLSAKKLNQYEPYLPALSVKLDDEVRDYIDASEKNVEELKEKEKKDIAEKRAAHVRKILLPIIGTLALVALGVSIFAFLERKKAQEANYKNYISAAYTFKSREQFDAAFSRLDSAVIYANNHNLKTKVKDTLTNQTISINSLRVKWDTTHNRIKRAKIFEDKIENSVDNDSLLIDVLNLYNLAYKEDPEVFIKNKKESTKKLIKEKFLHWMYKAEQFNRYNQVGFSNEAIINAKILAEKLVLDDVDRERIENFPK